MKLNLRHPMVHTLLLIVALFMLTLASCEKSCGLGCTGVSTYKNHGKCYYYGTNPDTGKSGKIFIDCSCTTGCK